MRLHRDEALARLTVLAQASGPVSVNVTGPLGVGKSRLLAAFPGLARESRRPLGQSGLEVVELTPWSDADIRSLCADLDDPDLVVRLAGGLPLLADVLARACRAGVRVPGALADAACAEVLRRLATEIRPRLAAALPVISTVDGADADLLADLVRLPADAFDRLRDLSVVRDEPHGLSVVEPFRTLFELAYTWRHPARRAEAAARTVATRYRQLGRTEDPVLRARLADQVLYLSGAPRVRRDLFAEAPGPVRVRAAGTQDADALGELVRIWAAAEGLTRRRADRMLGLWLAGRSHGFRLAVDGEDRPIGMVNLTELDADLPVLDPLLQQYAPGLLSSGEPGLVVGMMAIRPAYARTQPMLVREILSSAITAGRLVVSTPFLPYQQMSARFGLRRLGETRSDVYRCGRGSAVYTRRFAPDSLSAWLTRLGGRRPREEAVRDALTNLRVPARLASSPLAERAGSPEALARLLVALISALAASPEPEDAEAGRILDLYFVRRAGGHDLLAHRLHLSRATYFRRLAYGLAHLTDALP
ncbi:P-loop NTPase family protein [Hamadaea tsunoensis]|uniref:hypothetical protein n=1 Tax=Hamadaea tsunoensis TaxID=53368 RepID=UPI00041DF1C4|nr:hypothetical protein [Hamadaea tsunoensis]